MIPARHSPCIGLCKIDEETQLCLGCTRSAKEIAAWPSLDAAGRDAIWARLPARLPLLSVPFRILPWTTPEIADFVLATLRGSRPGTWTVGTPGATFEGSVEVMATSFTRPDWIAPRTMASEAQ